MPRAGNGLKLPCPACCPPTRGHFLGDPGVSGVSGPLSIHRRQILRKEEFWKRRGATGSLRASSVSVQRRGGQPVMGKPAAATIPFDFRFPFPVSVRSAVRCRRAATCVLEESGYMLGRCQDAQVQRDGHTRQKKKWNPRKEA
jgi:hypothetical protein